MFIIDRNEVIEDSEPEWEALWRKENEDDEIDKSLDTSLGRKRSVLGDIDAVRSANTDVVTISASCNKPTDTTSNVNIVTSRFACFAHDPTRAGLHVKASVPPSLSRASSSASIKSPPIKNDPPQNQVQNKNKKRQRTNQSQSKLTNEPQSQSELTESDVTHIAKCATCDTKWTTRKSSRQKLSHMRSCARKMGVNWDVVERIVRKELASNPKALANKGKGKDEAEKEVERLPQTLLEDTVKDLEPNKKRKRMEVVTSVKPVEESHGFINSRAKMLLDGLVPSLSDSNHQKSSSSKSTLVSAAEPIRCDCKPPPLYSEATLDPNNFSHPPLTQQFAPSKLPDLICPLPNFLNRESDADNNSYILPPSTQPFGMSRLALNFARAAPVSDRNFFAFDEKNDLSDTHLTQSFAPSKLSGITQHVSELGSDAADDVPPSTQPFGISKFAFAQPSRSIING